MGGNKGVSGSSKRSQVVTEMGSNKRVSGSSKRSQVVTERSRVVTRWSQVVQGGHRYPNREVNGGNKGVSDSSKRSQVVTEMSRVVIKGVSDSS
jgi:hypothetical protein